MNIHHSVRQRLLVGTIVGGSLLAMAGSAFAQEVARPAGNLQDQDEQATDIGEVVVTGSRIRRDPTNSPTPLIQLTGEQLLTTGQSTVIDYLATVPALQNSLVPSDTTGANLGIGGLALPNLRSLGAGRTLTLVDGRRHVGSNGGQLAVDVDAVPRLLIQNVEIVTGGASSVYGADAVSGVLNFILKKDFEGLEIDANYGMVNEGGQANKRLSVLAGANLLDDRLNIYVHGELEDTDEVKVLDIDWLTEAYSLVGLDADPATIPSDGVTDNGLFSNLRTLSRPRWGQTTLANFQRPSALLDPDVPLAVCNPAGNFRSANCFGVDPAKTFVFEGPTARLANFGRRVGETGVNRPLNIGGDGDNISSFGQFTRVPSSTSRRFQAGANFEVTSDIHATFEAKYVNEDTFHIGQPVFYDFFISNTPLATALPRADGFNQFDLRLEDNAFIPANLRAAIQANTLTPFSAPTNNAPGVAQAPVAAAFARHGLFGPDRTQDNTRELSRFVLGLAGEHDRFGFVDNISWDLSYTYGEIEARNTERGTDNLRVALGADAVVDTAGVLGTPGAIVCRSRILNAQGAPLTDFFLGGGDLRNTQVGRDAIAQCVPLNVFGNGNQSEAALAYIDAAITTVEHNEQEQAVASVSGQLWDVFGAGPIGVALGAEYRREYTDAIGRDADTAGRSLFLNTGPDFLGSEYESEEVFAELSLPLFSNTWLGEYGELSGSYRTADYTTVGKVDVFGVNLVYRPIADITFKTSFNSSVRVPDLSENFSPFVQTFANGFVDPCATTSINSPTLSAAIRANRIANCTALAQQKGLTFDFAGATLTNIDDFNPLYPANSVSGSIGGNPDLKPEESDSFTFSTVLEPRFFPNLSLVLDYYEIQISDVIATITGQTLANNCVSSVGLDPVACGFVFRNNPAIPFGLGAPQGDPIGGFKEGTVNFAKLETRGLDFTARYRLDTEEMFGRNWGQVDYSISGLWLLDQKQFLNSGNPDDFVELASTVSGTQAFPRVRFTSSLTWTPNEIWSFNWTADFQTASDIIQRRTFILNNDSRSPDLLDTGNFTRHDFTVRYKVDETLSLRAGVVNAFDAEQARVLGSTLISNYDAYGPRFFIGLNYRPY
ncbi:TonB-dependent receptor domain-containing protein [Brevundimonas sp.]|uniref:TonB-dependent receptor domain-containing protein n=1 Tax=Brevundimonas sp. TaxID=1871086 RepID=UPI002FCBE91A